MVGRLFLSSSNLNLCKYFFLLHRTTSCWTCILRHISTRYTVKSETELWCRYPSILMFRLLSASWFHFCHQFWTLPCRALCKKPWYGDRISSPLILTCPHFENVLWKLLYETRKITNRLISFLGGNSRFAESPDSVKRKSRYVCLAEALIILKGWKSCSDWFQSQQYYGMCLYRGTQRLFSVKYLVRRSKYCLEFSNT